ncbi:MAG: hypothetical protein IPL28_08530, partial [Chloroflexi bacterium]|nr:hypothetical protein [Chloroflexota bacterium]
TDLQDALGEAAAGDEIWVATGVYTPSAIYTESFQLVPGAGLYGGFIGSESEREQRDWETNPTVLSGDIDNNDITDPTGVVTSLLNVVGRNSFHVIYANGTTGTPITETTVVDGIIITAGWAATASLL